LGSLVRYGLSFAGAVPSLKNLRNPPFLEDLAEWG